MGYFQPHCQVSAQEQALAKANRAEFQFIIWSNDRDEHAVSYATMALLSLFAIGVVLLYPRVHDSHPERWKECQNNHGRIACGKLRAIVKMAQNLVTSLRIGVVVRVSL